jgi:hypothetical protein
MRRIALLLRLSLLCQGGLRPPACRTTDRSMLGRRPLSLRPGPAPGRSGPAPTRTTKRASHRSRTPLTRDRPAPPIRRPDVTHPPDLTGSERGPTGTNRRRTRRSEGLTTNAGSSPDRLPSWLCGFDSRHPLSPLRPWSGGCRGLRALSRPRSADSALRACSARLEARRSPGRTGGGVLARTRTGLCPTGRPVVIVVGTSCPSTVARTPHRRTAPTARSWSLRPIPLGGWTAPERARRRPVAPLVRCRVRR